MDNALLETVVIFATKPEKQAQSFIRAKSEEEIIKLFTDMLRVYMNDKNSSTLREKITLKIAGYESTDRKIGYDGFKKVNGKMFFSEVKPKNVDTENNKVIKTPRKHDGGGNFTDYTFARFLKDKKENPNMLISGFVNGTLIFVLEFPFKFSDFTNQLERLLKKRFPYGDKLGEYLRSARFTFEGYRKCKNLKIIYINKEELKNNKNNFSKPFYDFLVSINKQEITH